MPNPITATIALEMQFAGTAGAWTNVWPDVRLQSSLTAAYGISGGGPLDRVAGTGQMAFTLDNSQANSAGLLGYYAPGHANARSGFELGIAARLKITYGGTAYYKFVGTVEDITPAFGQYRSRETAVTVVDWMDEAAKQSVRLLATQTNKRADQLITTIVAAMTKQPTATAYGTGVDTFPYSLDNSRDEQFSPMTEFSRICRSELGYLFIKGDTSSGGKLTFQERHARPKAGSALSTFSDTMVALSASRARGRIYNRIKVTVHPRVVDVAATTVLYALSGTPLVGAGQTIEILGQYRDPAQRAIRVGGTAMVAPVATTDYLMNSVSDGSGSNLTANFTVTATYGGNGVLYSIANGGATAGYVTFLQARGKGVYDYAPLTAEASDSASKTAYGENVLALDMPMQTDVLVGQDAANYLNLTWKDPHSLIDTVEFNGNRSDAHMTAGLAREPGDRVAIAETATGINHDYYLQAEQLRVSAGGIIDFGWTVTPTDAFQAWILGVVTASELGQTTTLGY